MNKKLGLAVAGALAAFATSANAGISIPAGDWTVDIGGNVNAYYIHNNSSDSNSVAGGLANGKGINGSSASSINTGLLPSWLTIGAKTRQNDLDVAWAISFQPGASSAHSLQGGGGSEYRQAYMTIGDASWGSIKAGKDLGVFGSDAILNDITLLGVGSQGVVGATGGTTTTLGGIGSGYMYADFVGQINYTTPNWSGFQATVGIEQPWHSVNLAGNKNAADMLLNPSLAADPFSASVSGNQKSPAFSGKASYSFSANDVTGKVWAEFKTQKADGISTGVTGVYNSEQATVYGVGATASMAGFGLTGYYYSGEGAGTTAFLADGFDADGHKRNSDGGYVQATFTVPGVGTKLGVAYGISSLDMNADETDSHLVKDNERWTVGAYHPLTKSVNLVAEYNRIESTNHLNESNKSDIVSAGAILFF